MISKPAVILSSLFLIFCRISSAQEQWTITLIESSIDGSTQAWAGGDHLLGVNTWSPEATSGATLINAVSLETHSLHPDSFDDSRILDANATTQVGEVYLRGESDYVYHAALWNGTKESFVDLHPHGFTDSKVYAVRGDWQGGSVTDETNNEKAAVWNGTASSYINFHPSSDTWSRSKINAFSSRAQGGQLGKEAVIWHGSPDNFTRLGPYGGPSRSEVAAMTETMQGGSYQAGSNKWAVIWEGNRESMQILHPPTVHGASEIRAMLDDYQVGQAGNRASLWKGTKESWVDLHEIAVNQLGSSVTWSHGLGIYRYDDNVFVTGSVYRNDRTIAAIWHQVGTEVAFPEPEPEPEPIPPPTKLANLSGRAIPGVGEQAMIAGLVVDRGDESTVPLIFRGIGPTLQDYGVNNALNDPRISVRDGNGDLVAENGGWLARTDADQIRESSQALGAFALSETGNDSAMLYHAPQNIFTVKLDDEADSSGVGLIEIYFDGRESEMGGLKNLSLRANAGSGEAASIAGFVVKNDTHPNEPAKILLRVVGPTMGNYGIVTFLPDPVLTLRKVSGEEIVSVDNWSDVADVTALREAMTAVGAFNLPDGSRDAAALVELTPGSYTLTAEDKNGATGVVLMEIYLVE